MPSKPKTDEELHPERYFSAPFGHPKDRIIVNESSKIPREGQFVSLNGYGYLIRPGYEVDIPRPVRGMLDNCIETETFYGDDGKEYHRNIKRITYTLVKEDVEGLLAPQPQPVGQ